MPLECFRNGERFATLGSQGGSTTDRRTGVSISYGGDINPTTSITGVESNGNYVTKSRKLISKGAELILETHIINDVFNPLANDFFKGLAGKTVVVEHDIAKIRVARV